MNNYLYLLNENRTVEITLDPKLYTSIQEHNPHLALTPTVRIQINLFKLMIAIGTIQTRSYQPTELMKLNRVSDLIGLIKCDTILKINRTSDGDRNKSVSEDFGVGLSIMVAHHFFNLRWSRLGKIHRANESKPDIKCMTHLAKEIILEAKGSNNNNYRFRTQIPDAKKQKKNTAVRGDIRVASCSLLNEDSISNVDFSDPPILPPNDPEYTTRLLMADHYSRVFNFIGQKELSEYFYLMKQRIINDTKFKEYSYKEELYSKIKDNYIEIVHENRHYLGNIDKIDDSNYLFTGVTKELISLQGFLHFEDYAEKTFTQENNQFHVLSDGICMGKINNLVPFSNSLNISAIKSYHEYTTIIDLDHMRESLILEFFTYLFKKIGATEVQADSSTLRLDQIIKYKRYKYIVEYKKNIKMNLNNMIEQLLKYSVEYKIPKIILITLSTINKSTLPKNSDLIILDRPLIKSIINDHNMLGEYLSSK